MSEGQKSVTPQEFQNKIEGKEVKDVAVSAQGSHIDVVLDDGDPFTTITVRGEKLRWEIDQVRSVGTETN